MISRGGSFAVASMASVIKAQLFDTQPDLKVMLLSQASSSDIPVFSLILAFKLTIPCFSSIKALWN